MQATRFYFILMVCIFVPIASIAQLYSLETCSYEKYIYNAKAEDFTTYKKVSQESEINLNFHSNKMTIESAGEGQIFKILSERDRSKYSDDYQFYYPIAIDYKGDTCSLLFVLNEFKDPPGGTIFITYKEFERHHYYCEGVRKGSIEVYVP